MELWAKYAGATDYEQAHHRDYGNHTLVVPRADGHARQLTTFTMLSDVTEDDAPTRIVPLGHTTHLPLVLDVADRGRGDRFTILPMGELFDVEVPVVGPAGTVLLYRTDVFHRASGFAAAGRSRFSLLLRLRGPWPDLDRQAGLAQPCQHRVVARVPGPGLGAGAGPVRVPQARRSVLERPDPGRRWRPLPGDGHGPVPPMTPVVALRRLALGRVTLPEWHPRAAAGSCPINAYAIDHRDGVLVVDTGPRTGHPLIDELYHPEVITIVEALNRVSIDERDVVAVVNTHLHFDHCGQNHLLPHAPVWLSAAEVAAAEEPHYTVPEWAAVEPSRLRIAGDEEELAAGVTILHTPGHTPGHQSVAVETSDGIELVVGQACWTCREFVSWTASESAPGVSLGASDVSPPGETRGPGLRPGHSLGPATEDMHDEHWLAAGRESLDRLRALRPRRAVFSHDDDEYLPGTTRPPDHG